MRCKAITYAGQPGHLLVRCKLDEHDTGDHQPSWAEEECNS